MLQDSEFKNDINLKNLGNSLRTATDREPAMEQACWVLVEECQVLSLASNPGGDEVRNSLLSSEPVHSSVRREGGLPNPQYLDTNTQ